MGLAGLEREATAIFDFLQLSSCMDLHSLSSMLRTDGLQFACPVDDEDALRLAELPPVRQHEGDMAGCALPA